MDGVITKAALARELAVSKGAVTAYVRKGMPVRSDGRLNRREALAWIRGHVEPHHADRGAAVAGEAERRRPGRPEADAGLPERYRALLLCDTEPHAMHALGCIRMAYKVPASAALLALAAGASLPAAYALYAAMALSVMHHVTALTELPEDGVTFDLGAFDRCDWPALAAARGEAFDEAACEAHLRATFGDEAPQ